MTREIDPMTAVKLSISEDTSLKKAHHQFHFPLFFGSSIFSDGAYRIAN